VLEEAADVLFARRTSLPESTGLSIAGGIDINKVQPIPSLCRLNASLVVRALPNYFRDKLNIGYGRRANALETSGKETNQVVQMETAAYRPQSGFKL